MTRSEKCPVGTEVCRRLMCRIDFFFRKLMESAITQQYYGERFFKIAFQPNYLNHFCRNAARLQAGKNYIGLIFYAINCF